MWIYVERVRESKRNGKDGSWIRREEVQWIWVDVECIVWTIFPCLNSLS